jgi:CheY-like chemotaxis protein
MVMVMHDTCDRRNQELTVLVAEDNEINQIVVQKILQSAGYRMDLVDNGRQAVEFACRIQYDLILMDIQMPLMDGYEAAERIRNWEESRGQMSDVRGQRAEDRGQKAEGRGQWTEDRGQKTEDRRLNAEDGSQHKIRENSELKSEIPNPKSQFPSSKSQIPIPNSPDPIPHSPFKKVPMVVMTGNYIAA